MAKFTPATKPTMYFIGVTTKGSSINRVFPLWAKALRLPDCQLVGIDFKLHDDPARYREAVEFIKRDPMSLGALVTTHKIDLYAACRDLFDAVEPLSARMGEVSSIYKRSGKLHARAADPWTAGYALDAFLPLEHWRSGAEALILGAGGSAVALAWRLSKPELSSNRPKQIHVANRSLPRLTYLRELYDSWNVSTKLHCHHVPSPDLADALVRRLPPAPWWSTRPASERTPRARRSRTPRFSPSAGSRGSSTTAATSCSSGRRGRRRRRASCSSRTAGSTSSMAGRVS